jgi:hypothetical protein
MSSTSPDLSTIYQEAFKMLMPTNDKTISLHFSLGQQKTTSFSTPASTSPSGSKEKKKKKQKTKEFNHLHCITHKLPAS